MKSHLIALSISTKILYSLFNFFSPIGMTYLFICTFSKISGVGIVSSLVAFGSFLVGLFCLITNLIKYNRYLIITEDFIMICSGDKKKPKVLNKINRNDIEPESLNFMWSVISCKQKQGGKIELLHTRMSILSTLLWVGPIVIILFGHFALLSSQKCIEIVEFLPMLANNKIKKTKYDAIIFTIFNILAWIFVGFVSLFGILGLIFMPLYSFIQI